MKNQHGGDIWAVAREQGVSPEDIIDFSASINPLGLSKEAAAALEKGKSLLTAYPEPYAGALTRELARYHDIPAANILAANGSNELIYLIAQSVASESTSSRPEKALIVEPAFSEYKRALNAVGCEVEGFRLSAANDFVFDLKSFLEKLRGGYDICFVTNPTSHVGGIIPKADMLEIIEGCRRLGIFLVVDEAFCDFAESASVKGEAARGGGVIVLRSMTKFFAMAGLRLGYAIASEKTIERLASVRPTWSVNLLAMLAGVASLKDKSYIERTLSWFNAERPFMEGLLGDISGIKLFPGAANFFLCKADESCKDVRTLSEMLTSRGVLIRDMSNVDGLGPGYFRIALRSRHDNELLAALLDEAFSGKAAVQSSVS